MLGSCLLRDHLLGKASLQAKGLNLDGSYMLFCSTLAHKPIKMGKPLWMRLESLDMKNINEYPAGVNG